MLSSNSKGNESQSVSCSVVFDSWRPHGLQPVRLLCPWNSPGENPGVGSHLLLQGIFPTQGSNPGLLHCRQTLYHLSHQGSPRRSVGNQNFLVMEIQQSRPWKKVARTPATPHLLTQISCKFVYSEHIHSCRFPTAPQKAWGAHGQRDMRGFGRFFPLKWSDWLMQQIKQNPFHINKQLQKLKWQNVSEGREKTANTPKLYIL